MMLEEFGILYTIVAIRIERDRIIVLRISSKVEYSNIQVQEGGMERECASALQEHTTRAKQSDGEWKKTVG